MEASWSLSQPMRAAAGPILPLLACSPRRREPQLAGTARRPALRAGGGPAGGPMLANLFFKREFEPARESAARRGICVMCGICVGSGDLGTAPGPTCPVSGSRLQDSDRERSRDLSRKVPARPRGPSPRAREAFRPQRRRLGLPGRRGQLRRGGGREAGGGGPGRLGGGSGREGEGGRERGRGREAKKVA